MVIMIVNNSGNVGKSALSRELFYSNMNDPVLIEIESHNSASRGFEGINQESIKRIKGDEFEKIYVDIITADDVIIDVGASNIDTFLNGLLKYKDVFEIVNLFVIPAVPDPKQSKDTVKIAKILKSLGVADENVKVILNRTKSDPKHDFAFLAQEAKGVIKLDPKLAIYEYPVIGDLDKHKLISKVVLEDPQDYRALAKHHRDDPQKALEYSNRDLMRRQSLAMHENMASVFEVLHG